MNTMLKYYLITISLMIGIVGCAPKEVVKPEVAQETLPTATPFPQEILQSEIIQPSEIEPERPQTQPKPSQTKPMPTQKPPKKLPLKVTPKPVSPYIIVRSCDNNCDSYKPKKLYLYGGKAIELFEAYLSESNGIKKRIPDNFQILFYEKNGADLKLAESVSAHWMVGMVVDSKEAFLNILKDKLGERIAERPDETDDALINKALSEKADIILCCRKAKTKKGNH